MKRIDASPDGIFEIAWSVDSKWIAYVRGEEEICLANAESGEIRIIGKGASPAIAHDMSVVFERGGEIVRAKAGGESILVDAKALVRDAPKRGPVASPDGTFAVFVVCNVYDKKSEQLNAYPYRHFLGLVPIDGASQGPKLLSEQWYGGTITWFPSSKWFAHFEFDSTGGPQVHIVTLDGTKEGIVGGMFPSISPDALQIAARPRGGGTIAVYNGRNGWADDKVETTIVRFPAERGSGQSSNPPIWIDNRLVIADEGGKVFRLDTKRDKGEELKKIPAPTQRRKPSMIASPNRELIALEIAVENGYELRVIPMN